MREHMSVHYKVTALKPSIPLSATTPRQVLPLLRHAWPVARAMCVSPHRMRRPRPPPFFSPFPSHPHPKRPARGCTGRFRASVSANMGASGDPGFRMPRCRDCDIEEASIKQLQQWLSNGAFSSWDLTSCYLARIQALNSRLRLVDTTSSLQQLAC